MFTNYEHGFWHFACLNDRSPQRLSNPAVLRSNGTIRQVPPMSWYTENKLSLLPSSQVSAGALNSDIRLLTPCTVWAQLYKVNPLTPNNASVAAPSAVGSPQCLSNWPGPSQGSGAKLGATIVPAYNGSRCNGGLEVRSVVVVLTIF